MAQGKRKTSATKAMPELPADKPKRGRGRPATGKYVIPEMIEAIEAYTAERYDAYKRGEFSGFPTLRGICYEQGWEYSYVVGDLRQAHKDLSHTLTRMNTVYQDMIETGGLTKQLDGNFAKFILRQPAHGYTDKPIHELQAEVEAHRQIAETAETVHIVLERGRDE